MRKYTVALILNAAPQQGEV